MCTKKTFLPLALCLCMAHTTQAQTADSARVARTYDLDEVVVTGSRQAIDPRLLPMTVTTVDSLALSRQPGQSVLPALTEQVPGLFITGRGLMGYGVSTGAAGGMSLRGIGGSPTAGMLVLVDGHPQYMGLMGHPIADAYQTMLAGRVEVVRGPASVLYGSNAMGGVINIVTRQQHADGLGGTADVSAGSYGTAQAQAGIRLRQGPFHLQATANYGRTDGHRPDMAFEQEGGYVKAGYDFGPHWQAVADMNVTHFNASNPGTVASLLIDNDSRITRGMASLALRNHHRLASGAVSLYYNWGHHRIDDGYSPGEQPQTEHFNSKDRMAGLSLYETLRLLPGNSLTLGLDYRHFGGQSWYRHVQTGERRDGVDKTQHEVAAYANVHQDISTWLSLDAGLRVDHHSHVGTTLVPQGGLAFHLPRRAELKASVSKGFRNPTIREMYMFPPQNPDLRAESIVNYELAFTQTLPGGTLSYGLNLFYIHGSNTIVLDPSVPRYFNSGAVENCGVEAELSWRLSPRWSADANYSYLHMDNPVLGAPEHKLHAALHYRHGRWTATAGVQHVRGLCTAMGQAPSFETFTLVDARLSFRLCRPVELYVNGENLLAERYETLDGYPMPKATFTGGLRVEF